MKQPAGFATVAERDLVAAILRKDRKAAASFVAAYIDGVYTFVRHRLASREDLVDDVVQDVFLASLNGLATFRGQSSLHTWLLGIARHKIEDIYRQRLRWPDSLEDADAIAEAVVVGTTSLDDQIDAARSHERARRVLVKLPERDGLLLAWRYWEQRSTRDIAAAVGTTEKSVERRLARARARFKELWLQE